MIRLASLAALLLLAGCSKQPDDVADPHGKAGANAEKSAPGGMGGPPALPPYQMRAVAAAGSSDGEALFSNRCGSCHLAGGMGTNLITKQRIAAGETPDKGLLANRTDLTAEYVTSVVRNGKMAMPRLTRVDVTDAELEAIAGYLGKARP